jgi:hypothetical protein
MAGQDWRASGPARSLWRAAPETTHAWRAWEFFPALGVWYGIPLGPILGTMGVIEMYSIEKWFVLLGFLGVFG